MRKIPLTQGQFAIVDSEDYKWLNQFKWCFNNGYAVRHVRLSPRVKQTRLMMHRVIMNAPEGMEVDHVNSNRLDNRRNNLRICSPIQNSFNRQIPANNTSGFKGVTLFRTVWRVKIQGQFIGYFPTKEEARDAYNREAVKRFGEFAKLNPL